MSLDPYKVLGLEPGVGPDEIKRAYRKLALRWHPDRVPPELKAEAEERFKEITQAYELLMNGAPDSSFDWLQWIVEVLAIVAQGFFEKRRS